MVHGKQKISFTPDDVLREALAAESRVRPSVRVTPLRESRALGEKGGCRCLLKLETRQVTGSFKARGAEAFLTGVLKHTLDAGVVTASTGNHGLGVVWAARIKGVPVHVVIPENASPFKTGRMEEQGATVRIHGSDVMAAETFARGLARERGMTYIPPYNHPWIIAGQAGVALELEKQLGRPDHILVPVGGGGLIAGIAGWYAARGADTRITGCQPENSAAMAASVAAGRILDFPSRPTLAAASAGGIEPGAITFSLCRDLVGEWQKVSEKEIWDAMDFLRDTEGIRVEGAAALPVAVFMRNPRRFRASTVVMVISGGNLDPGERE